MPDVLEVRLHHQPRRNLRLIGQFKVVFIARHQAVGTGPGHVAGILALARTGAANAPAQPDRVVVTSPERGLQVQARVNGEADQVTIAAIARGAHENTQRTRGLDGRPPDHLVNDAVHHPVAPVPARDAGGVIGAAKGLSHVVVAVIGKSGGVVISAQFIDARQAGIFRHVGRIGGLRIECVLQFGNQQRAITHVEVCAIGAVIGLAGGIAVAAQYCARGLLDG
ncbi:hypothetical protein MSKU3_3315 [Komagataeibacter oboediens]|nr:hypothetical protein MSKU3_3315 [Komagataeibacter oboediens]